MEFEANRTQLLQMATKAIKLAPASAGLEALRGIFIECDDESGEVTMIATDFEAAIYLKEHARVVTNGNIIIEARLLVSILTKLAGDKVQFLSEDGNSVKIYAEKCTFHIQCLPGNHYPKPMMPYPEDTIQIKDIGGLVKKTAFAASKEEGNVALQSVCLRLTENNPHAAACDGKRMMLVKSEAECSGNREFLLPRRSLQIIASVSNEDDVYDVGSVDRDVIFTRRNMLFSMKQTAGKFIDVNTVIKAVVPKYAAIVDSYELRTQLELVQVGSGSVPVNMVFQNTGIKLECDGELGRTKMMVDAKISVPTPTTGFYYNVKYLVDLFKVISGVVKIELDAKGMMLVRTQKKEIYFQMPQMDLKKKEESKKLAA